MFNVKALTQFVAGNHQNFKTLVDTSRQIMATFDVVEDAARTGETVPSMTNDELFDAVAKNLEGAVAAEVEANQIGDASRLVAILPVVKALFPHLVDLHRAGKI